MMKLELEPFQAAGINEIRQALLGGSRRVVAQSPTGSGKCLGIGTKVVKFDGSIVPVECIRSGDLLMGPDSTPRRVLSTCVGTGPMFRIVPIRGEPWICNDVHVLTLVYIVNGNVVDVPLNEYLKKSKNFKWTHKLFSPPDGINFDTDFDPDMPPYFLGLWIGDGTKALRGLAISKPDREVEEECGRIAVANGGFLRTDYATNGRCPTYHIVTPRGQPNRLLSRMRHLMAGGGIPLCVLTASRQYRAQVLAGIIDTDGYIHNGSCEIAQRSEKIAEGIAFLARSLGFKVTCSDKVVNGTVYKRMGISGDISQIPTRIARKKAPPRKQVKCATRTGFEVHPIGVGKYAGFTLDGDGRFLLGDFTVTHNTIISSAIADLVLNRGKRMMFTVPRIALIDQTIDKFSRIGILDIGVIQSNHPLYRPQAQVQIASVQTLESRGHAAIPMVDLVIQDECHRTFDFVVQWMASPAWARVPFVGLTATPWPRGMGRLYDRLVVIATMRQLMSGEGCRDGKPRLKSRVRMYSTELDGLDKVDLVAGEYHQGQTSTLVSEKKIVGDGVRMWLEMAERRPTFAFCVKRADARILQQEFSVQGVPTGYIDAYTDRDERERLLRMLRDREIEVICSVEVLTTGIDEPCVSCILDRKPTKSESDLVQRYGRGMRAFEGVDDCLVLDQVGNYHEHGHFVDIHHDRLDDSDRKAKGIRAKAQKRVAKPCNNCFFVMPSTALKCPACGTSRPLHAGIETVDGNLVEVGSGRKAAKAQYTMMDKVRWFAELKGYVAERGQNPGRAFHLFREKFNAFPERSIRDVAPEEPSLEVHRWVRSRNIRFAKAREKAQRQEGQMA